MSDFLKQFKSVPKVTTALIIVNILIFLAMLFIPAASSWYELGAISPIALMRGEWWTVITSMFLHSSIMHIMCNMISLYYLGVMCERVFGSVRFAILYLVSGIVGNLAFVGINIISGDMFSAAVGASGAVFGLFGAYGYLLIRERKAARVFAYSPTKADIQSYIFFLVVNLLIGFAPGSNIANAAHLGGMACGFIIGAIMYYAIAGKGGVSGSGRTGAGSKQMIQPQSQHPQYRRATRNDHPAYDDPRYR